MCPFWQISHVNCYLKFFVCIIAEFEEKSELEPGLKPGTETNMIMERLGKWLFPRSQPYRQKREMRTILVALGVALIVAAVMSAVIILTNSASLGR